MSATRLSLLTAVLAAGLAASAVAQAGYLGVGIEDADIGVRIQNVAPGSPAEAAGLAADDVILKVGEKAVSGMDMLIETVRAIEPGTVVLFTVRRGEETLKIKVKIGRREADGAEAAPEGAKEESAENRPKEEKGRTESVWREFESVVEKIKGALDSRRIEDAGETLREAVNLARKLRRLAESAAPAQDRAQEDGRGGRAVTEEAFKEQMREMLAHVNQRLEDFARRLEAVQSEVSRGRAGAHGQAEQQKPADRERIERIAGRLEALAKERRKAFEKFAQEGESDRARDLGNDVEVLEAAAKLLRERLAEHR